MPVPFSVLVPVKPVHSSLLTGHTELYLCSDTEAALLGAPVHAEVVKPILRLQEDARQGGFDLRILSGFRGFERQLSIWNRKVRGELPVLDSGAQPLEIDGLAEEELVFAILRWSALPGASRHHWGTDLDVFDAAARPEGYEIELIPEEVDSAGMFGPLHDWLDHRMAASEAQGFFRPYDKDRGGVAPERWHLSYSPVAGPLERRMSAGLLRDAVRNADMELKEVVVENLDEIYERFVTNIGRPLR